MRSGSFRIGMSLIWQTKAPIVTLSVVHEIIMSFSSVFPLCILYKSLYKMFLSYPRFQEWLVVGGWFYYLICLILYLPNGFLPDHRDMLTVLLARTREKQTVWNNYRTQFCRGVNVTWAGFGWQLHRNFGSPYTGALCVDLLIQASNQSWLQLFTLWSSF